MNPDMAVAAAAAEAPRDADWRGIHAVMVTPFNADGSLDLQGLSANVQFLAERPVDAVICLGSEGEFYAMTDEERRSVAETTADALAGRRPLVIGVSCPSATQAKALASHAASLDADAVLATPPYFGQPSLDMIRAHFAAIAEAGLPVFLYNAPSRVGYRLRPADLVPILDEPGVIGVKQASPDVAELVELIGLLDGTERLVIGGSESTIWPALSVGAVGNTATAASAIPDVFARLWQLSQGGASADGLRLYRLLAPLRQAYSLSGGQAGVVKRLMDRAGLCGGAVRPPARPSADAAEPLLDSLVASLTAEGMWAA